MATQLQRNTLTVLRLPQVMEKVGISRSGVYQRVKEGSFPPAVRLGRRSVGWLEGEIDDWLAARIEESRKGAQS
jgi:prophage regulatory protein